MPTDRTYPAGVPCWIDTEQPDVAAAAEFYGGLFGWTFTDAMPPDAPGTYLIASLNGADAAAIGPAEGATAWNTYIAVDDTDATADAVRAAGGVITTEPVDAGPGGRRADCVDPEGAAFRLWQPRRRLGVQVVNVPGSWNFSDLHSGDPGAAMEFYSPLFDWQANDLGFATMVAKPGYGDHLQSTVDPDIHKRQTEAGVPPGFADAIAWLIRDDGRPRWHVSFAVTDRDESADRAQALGATVIESEDTEWTHTALIRDPQGATLTLSQFTPPG